MPWLPPAVPPKGFPSPGRYAIQSGSRSGGPILLVSEGPALTFSQLEEC